MDHHFGVDRFEDMTNVEGCWVNSTPCAEIGRKCQFEDISGGTRKWVFALPFWQLRRNVYIPHWAGAPCAFLPGGLRSGLRFSALRQARDS